MHHTFVSLIERRGRNVTLGVVEALAKTFGVSVTDLLTSVESLPKLPSKHNTK